MVFGFGFGLPVEDTAASLYQSYTRTCYTCVHSRSGCTTRRHLTGDQDAEPMDHIVVAKASQLNSSGWPVTAFPDIPLCSVPL